MISDETLTNLPSSVPRGKRVKCGADSVDVEREEQSGAGFAYDCMKVYSYQSEMRFAYDGWNMIAEVGQRPPDAPSANLYVWGLDLSGSLQGAGGIGGLLAAQLGTNSVFYTYDGNGNVSELINTLDGTIAAHYEYSPFGEVLVATGDLASKNPFQFSTKYFDAETGLNYYGYRYYHPGLGRWINRDPIALGGCSQKSCPQIGLFKTEYLFCQNEPILLIDMLGLSPCSPCPFGARLKKGGTCGNKYRTKKPNGKTLPVNGCGSDGTGWVIPDSFMGLVNFTDCCNEHDRCYSHCGSTKGGCDSRLSTCMAGACGKIWYLPPLYVLCVSQSASYGAGLGAVGWGPYQSAQDDVCIWEDCCVK